MELLTIREPAALLRVSPVTVRRYISARRLAAVRVGKGVRVRKEDVERLPESVDEGIGQAKARSRGLFTKDDALWQLVGIGGSATVDVSENKYKYLAEAYATNQDK
jgi:excisionase family DNA binding protein